MIPIEAVEAVAKVYYHPSGDIAVDADEWMTCCREAQQALEVAAPYMLVEAWEEGMDAGLNGGWDNPYEVAK